MKIILKDNQNYIVRFDVGEEVVGGLAEFARAETIDAAHFTAIGAAGEAILSYYNLETKQYEDHEVKEDLEITSIVGNIATMMDSGSPALADSFVASGMTEERVVSGLPAIALAKAGMTRPEAIIHAHGTVSRKDLSVIGGHVKKLVVSATCEVRLTKLGGSLVRKHDRQTGLNLLV